MAAKNTTAGKAKTSAPAASAAAKSSAPAASAAAKSSAPAAPGSPAALAPLEGAENQIESQTCSPCNPDDGACVDMKCCITCTQLKDSKLMFICIKAGSKGSPKDVWKCRACHALDSRVARLRDIHEELVDGYREMEHATKADFMQKAAKMFQGDLAKELQEALHPHTPKSDDWINKGLYCNIYIYIYTYIPRLTARFVRRLVSIVSFSLLIYPKCPRGQLER